jgi:hypothetical protein
VRGVSGATSAFLGAPTRRPAASRPERDASVAETLRDVTRTEIEEVTRLLNACSRDGGTYPRVAALLRRLAPYART